MKHTSIAVASVLFAVGAGLLATAAIAGGGHRRSAIKEGGTLRINVSNSDVQSIDPAIDYEFIGWPLENATCVKLVNYPDKPGLAGTVLTPEAARSLPRVSADGKTYAFTIRP